MKAAVMFTSDSIPEYREFDEPVANEGREIANLVATGIHPIVHALAVGQHYGSLPLWPLVPGVDAVARTSNGMLVYTGAEQPYGTLAERMLVSKTLRFPLPVGAEPVQIAAGLNPGLSSWIPLKLRAAEIDELGTIVVLGATGMAGLLAVQNARLLGASRVIGAGRNLKNLERLSTTGVRPVVLTGDREVDARSIIKALDGNAPSLVLDFVWRIPAEAAFLAFRRHGFQEDNADISYVQIGAAAGAKAALPAELLRSRRIRISGSGTGFRLHAVDCKR